VSDATVPPGSASAARTARAASLLLGLLLFLPAGPTAAAWVLAGRPFEAELASAVLAAVPLLLLSAWPWPRGPRGLRFPAALFVGAAWFWPLVPILALRLDYVRGALPLLASVPCQVVMVAAAVSAGRGAGTRPARFSPLFWGLAVTAASPTAILAGVLLVVPGAHHDSGDRNTVAALRSFVSAQYGYEATAGAGAFGEPRCLARPADCSADWPEGRAGFLGPGDLAGTRFGYQWTFHPIPRNPSDTAQPQPLAGFALLAVRHAPAESGARSFCTDSSGILCILRATGPVELSAGLCPADCQPLH
jgi:hypothetical protein